jgi:bile acid:Na+ symporter, BASS family
MIKFIKNWTLPVSMFIGAAGYPLIVHLDFLTPYLIFLMLLFTFCKVSIRDMHVEPLHWWLMGIQVFGAILVFAIVYPFNKWIAEGAMVCVIAPTATAAAVITGKLGGSVPSLTSYTLLSSLITAIFVPLFFSLIFMFPPHIEVHATLGFWSAFTLILVHVFPLLIGPFVVAWFIRSYMSHLHHIILGVKDAAFYLWGVSLAIVTAITVKSLIESDIDVRTEILVAMAGLITCCLQFYFGKAVGSVYDNRISGGQGLGQKNTILAIWIALTYLNPTAALAPGSYVLWQNIINSWQLWQKRRKDVASIK